MKNEKRETTEGTAKSEQHQVTWRKGKLQVLGIIGS